MDIGEWKAKALIAIEKIPPGTNFMVKDLFEGIDWNSLTKGDRLSFGRYFKNAVKENVISDVGYIGKATNNSAIYIKRGGEKNETVNM